MLPDGLFFCLCSVSVICKSSATLEPHDETKCVPASFVCTFFIACDRYVVVRVIPTPPRFMFAWVFEAWASSLLLLLTRVVICCWSKNRFESESQSRAVCAAVREAPAHLVSIWHLPTWWRRYKNLYFLQGQTTLSRHKLSNRALDYPPDAGRSYSSISVYGTLLTRFGRTASQFLSVVGTALVLCTP